MVNYKIVSALPRKEFSLPDITQRIEAIYATLQEAIETSYEISLTTLDLILKDSLFTSESRGDIYSHLDAASRSKFEFIAWTLSENGLSDGLIALFQLGLPVDLVQTELETSFLINAVQTHDVALVQFLKDQQAPLDYATSLGTTAQSLAMDNGYEDILAILS
jgi:hypothetical protein